MALPATAPLVEVYRGDTTHFGGFRFFQPGPDAETPGPVQNVSTWTWRAQWRETPDSEEFIELDLQLDDTANGYVYVDASADKTAQMTPTGVWDLQATIPGIGLITKVAGKTKTKADVTRA